MRADLRETETKTTQEPQKAEMARLAAAVKTNQNKYLDVGSLHFLTAKANM